MKAKHSIALLLLTSLLVMVLALYNGFPLAESDTGAYIEKGILSIIPQDRSPFYGWFMRYTSMWTSLWFTVFVQSLMLSFLLLRYIRSIVSRSWFGFAPQSGERLFGFMLFTVLTIVSFTCLSWVASYLMPDIFAGILLLAALLLLTGENETISMQTLYAVFMFIAIIIHNSHFLIAAIFSAILLVWAVARKIGPVIRRSLIILSLSALSWLLMCTVNYANGYDFTFSRGSHVFMVTKFAETGILSSYLDDNCGAKNLKLCNYRDQIPAYSWDFLWSPESPLYKTGGWDSNRAEYNIIIHDVFTTPKYLQMFAAKSAIATVRELSQVQAPDRLTNMGYGSNPWWMVWKYFADELREYNAAKQNTDGVSATAGNYLYYLFFICSSLWLFFRWRLLGRDLLFVYCTILLFLLVNAFVTATASTVIYRFQYRVFWVLPATNAILLAAYYWQKYGNLITEKKRAQ